MPRFRSFLVFLVAALCAFSAFGQGTTGSIMGTVTTEGQPLPGVTVTISSPAMQGSRTAVTGEGGGYTFPSVPPGSYTVVFDLAGMSRVTRNMTVTLGTTARADADMRVSAVAEAITVTAAAPAVLETTDVARNFTSEEVAELPVRRNITDTVLITPGVNQAGARGNIVISGAPSYDSLYLVNGVVVNENLRGQPHDLFIEDAIQETTVFTGSISAEYGRFSGGVVSALTKSGGNEFHGSFRDNLTNAAWIEETEIETTEHPDEIGQVYEGTLGGFVMRDRLWFFAAGRHAAGAPAVGFNPTGSTVINNNANTSASTFTFPNTVDEDRYEVKLTGQILPQHSLVGSYLNVDRVETNNFFAPIYDQASIVPSRSLPNDLLSVSYNGVITSNLLLEAAYAEKNFAFVGSGGRFTDFIKGTWISDSQARWNAPVFCGVCTDEERNNDSLFAKATYFVNTRSMGTHNFVIGGEDYAETRLVNNFQSASQFEINSTGTAVLRNGNIYPTFDTNTRLRHRPILQQSQGSDLATRSFFVNDKWDFSDKLSFNIGVRYDKNDATDASGNVVSDDSAFSPRLGVAWDVKGDSRFRVTAGYSHYVTKIVDGNVGGGAAGAGAPALFSYRYTGPVVNPAGTPVDQLIPTEQALQIMLDWYNSLTEAQKSTLVSAGGVLDSSSIPGYTTQIIDPISSPFVRELTLGFGSQIGARGFARVDLIRRDWHDFYATRVAKDTGTFTAPNGAKGDLQVIVNDDENISREYNGIQTQVNWAAGRFNIGGGYTWSTLKGNDVPEGDGTAGVTNQFGQFYPEYLNYENRQPEGYLTGDQRHRVRVWLGYDIPFPIGNLNATLLQAYDSGRAFSAIGTVNASPSGTANTPREFPDPGYIGSSLGTTHNYYFGGRGAFRTDDTLATDLALNYTLPIRNFALFAQGQVLNIFNGDTVNDVYLNRMNLTVHTARSGGAGGAGLVAFNPRTETPVEGTHYRYDAGFGTAANKDAYQQPRTYRFSLGFRF
jgi:hypothetical protein